MAERTGLAIFGYAYRPLHTTNPQDGGFSVNLLQGGLLIFNEYSLNLQITREIRFQLPADTAWRTLALIEQSRPWLPSVPPRMTTGEDTVSEYTFCFAGYNPFRMEDMIQLMDCPFRTMRGHYVRLVYGLMESISSLLLNSGVDLQPGGFRWDERIIQPLTPPQPPMGIQNAHYA